VRGTATGTLAAFDAFLNLVLTDATEDYTVRAPVERARPPRPEDGGVPRPPRRCHALQARTRALRTVFVRGDAVVAVAVVES
jgi:small nuclear ribonucleoprotein (snRNP)-like protein